MRVVYLVVTVAAGALASVVVSGSRELAPAVEVRASEGQAPSGPGCTLHRLAGRYAVEATGTVVTPPPQSGIPAGPFATVGTLDLDGAGNAVLNATRSFNGVIVRETNLPGTLTLDGGCTGAALFQGGRAFDVVVLDQQREMRWIQTNPGTVVTIVMKRL